MIVVEMRDDLTDAAGAPTVPAVHAYREGPGPLAERRANASGSDREQGLAKSTGSVVGESSKRSVSVLRDHLITQ